MFVYRDRNRFHSSLLMPLTTWNLTDKRDERFITSIHWAHSTTVLQHTSSASHSAWTAAVRVTFAFGAFLASPLESASDQAVIGAQILCAVGKQGHGLVSTSITLEISTKWLSDNTTQIKLELRGSYCEHMVYLSFTSDCPRSQTPPVCAAKLMTFTSPHTCSVSLFLLWFFPCIQTLFPSLPFLLLLSLFLSSVDSISALSVVREESRWSRVRKRRRGLAEEIGSCFLMVVNQLRGAKSLSLIHS